MHLFGFFSHIKAYKKVPTLEKSRSLYVCASVNFATDRPTKMTDFELIWSVSSGRRKFLKTLEEEGVLFLFAFANFLWGDCLPASAVFAVLENKSPPAPSSSSFSSKWSSKD